MFPTLALDNRIDKSRRHAISAGQRSFADVARCIDFSDCSYLISSEFGIRTLFSNGEALWLSVPRVLISRNMPSRLCAGSMSSFLSHILIVVSGGSQKQVVRPNTQFYIAMMTDIEAVRNGAIEEFPGKTMSAGKVPALTAWPKLSITGATSGTSPKPTIARSVNVLPEAFGRHKLLCFAGALMTAINRFVGRWSIKSLATLRTNAEYPGRMTLHDEPPIRYAMPGAVRAAPWLYAA